MIATKFGIHFDRKSSAVNKPLVLDSHTIWPSWNNGSEPLSQDKQHGHAVSFPHLPLTAPSAPIPGSRKEERLKENAGAADIILTASEMTALDCIVFVLFC